jgi:hypothetical protein
MGAPPPVFGKPGTPAKAVAVCSEELGRFVDLAFGLAVGLAVAVGAGAARHSSPVMALESKVTAPVFANARPSRLAPVCRLTDVDARIFPMNAVYVPIVAELTSRHHTLHALPPVTDEWDDVVRVAADLKIQTSLSPPPRRIRVPLSSNASAQ